MDQNRVIADSNLIDELLSCPSGEEVALLQANEELIDADLILVMEQVATKLATEGSQDSADFLQNLATQLNEMLTQGPPTTNSEESRNAAYLNLIDALLTSPTGEEAAQILKGNQDLVDAGLVKTMAKVIEMLAHSGEQKAAEFLVGLARQLVKSLGLA
jgi:hypothetical protein